MNHQEPHNTLAGDQRDSKSMTRRRLIGNLSLFALSATALGSFAKKSSAAAWDKHFVLDVHFAINDPGEGRYHRPFVAVWIEDANSAPVRTLSLWLQKTAKGPRYWKELKRWYREEKERRAVKGGDLIKSVSGATRPPGQYSVTWDGRDDAGKPVAQGHYVLCIEAAREHGTYQLIKTDLNIGPRPFSKTLPGNIEIKGATVAYRRK
jgi:thiamine biosynthesis lipoprotein